MPLGGILAGVGAGIGNAVTGIGSLTKGFLGSAVRTLAGQAPDLSAATLGSGVLGGVVAGQVGAQFASNEIAKLIQGKPQQTRAAAVAQTGAAALAPPGGSPQFFGTGVPSFTPVPQGGGGFGGPMPGIPGVPNAMGFGPAIPAVLGGLAGAGGRILGQVGGVIARNPGVSGAVGGVLAGEAIDAIQASGQGTAFFRATASGARPLPLVMIPNPVTGAPTFFKSAGRPVLFSSDFSAAKKVAKLASRARRKR